MSGLYPVSASFSDHPDGQDPEAMKAIMPLGIVLTQVLVEGE
jgi:hypothetical protein